MTFDMSQYRVLALRTEAPVTDKAHRQVVRGYEFIRDILEECRDNAPLIDRLKKYCIYGKDDEKLVEQLMPTYPTGERAERIRQCIRLLHALIGIIGECGEVAAPVLAYIEGEAEELDQENMEEETGDLLWFLNLLKSSCGPRDLVDTARRNIAKLGKRFKDKFTEDEYDNRDRATEMLALNSETPGKDIYD